MIKKCILLLVFVLVLFLKVEALSFKDKTLLSSKFLKYFSASKKCDEVKKLYQVKKYLSKYGYFGSSKVDSYQKSSFTLNDTNVFDPALEKAIKKFQLFLNLNVSGILDKKTLSRRDFPDLVNRTLIKHKLKLVRDSFKSGSYYVLGNTTWPIFNLTWAVAPQTRLDAINSINSAFNTWGNVKFNINETVTNFKFTRSSNYSGANVKISFAGVNELYGFPFQGNPGALAYSFYPPDGELHFNARIPWVNGAEPGKMDIETVALHELGHVLGLYHSNVPSAVMWPTSEPGVTKRNLHDDDIAGIKALYNFP